MYTTRIEKPNMTFQRIEPLDPRIVRIRLTSDLTHESVSDVELGFFADVLATKTKTRDKEGIVEYLNAHGIELDIEGGVREITCSMSVTKRNLKAGLSILMDVLQNAELTQREFTLTQKRALEELREARDSAKLIARINFARAVYPNGDIRRSNTLDEQLLQLKKLKHSDFARMKRMMLGGRWLMSAVADKSDQRALLVFAESFSHTKAIAAHVSVTPLLPKQTLSTYETVSGKTNIELRMGHRLPIALTHEAYPALAFGLTVLGDVGGFAGRLMSIVREKEGLTYGIYARIEAAYAHDPGVWNIFTFFTAKDLKQGITSTLRELNRLLKDGITDRELSVFKEMHKNDFLISHESNERRLGIYHNLLILGLDEAWLVSVNERTAALTATQVNEALRQYIVPKELAISGAGPVTKSGKGIIV